MKARDPALIASDDPQHQCFDPWWNYRCWHVGGQDETSMEGSKNSSSAGSSSVAHREMTSKRRNLNQIWLSVFTDAEPFDRSSYDGTAVSVFCGDTTSSSSRATGWIIIKRCHSFNLIFVEGLMRERTMTYVVSFIRALQVIIRTICFFFAVVYSI